MRIELKILNLLGNKYMLLFAGWFFSRVILSTLRTIIIGPFVFLPGFLILLYYLVLLTKKVYDNTHSQRQLIFITGIISDSILYWMIRAGTDSSFSLKSPWDNTIWIGSFTCLLFISFSFFF